MHIIISLLGTIITILILLNRLAEAGISLGGLNPFLWRRRQKWKKQYEGNPIYQIDSPLDLAALLATATAKADGDMSSDEKKALLDLFQNEFNVDRKGAAELLISSAFLLGSGEELKNNLEKVIKPVLENFTEDQATSTRTILDGICSVDVAGNELKRDFADRIKNVIAKPFEPKKAWN